MRITTRAAAIGLIAASLGSAALPASGVAATKTTTVKTGYTITVKDGVLAQGNTVRAKVTVTNPEPSVRDWWSRATVAKVVKKGVNGGYEMPYRSQGYNCKPIVRSSGTSFFCRLQGADVPTKVLIRFKADYA